MIVGTLTAGGTAGASFSKCALEGRELAHIEFMVERDHDLRRRFVQRLALFGTIDATRTAPLTAAAAEAAGGAPFVIHCRMKASVVAVKQGCVWGIRRAFVHRPLRDPAASE